MLLQPNKVIGLKKRENLMSLKSGMAKIKYTY